MKLQSLLSAGFFGRQYHPDMILSVNTISSPFRGTQIVYALGEDVCNAPDVRPLSLGDLIGKGVHVWSYLWPLVPSCLSFLDFHAESRALSFREASFISFLGQLWKSDWSASRDATPYDVTFEAAEEREDAGEGATNPRTYYRSHCATMGMSDEHSSNGGVTFSLLQKAVFWPLYLSSRTISAFDFSVLRPTPRFLNAIAATHPSSGGGKDRIEDGIVNVDEGAGYVSNALRANDGVVPLFSQWHPCDCENTLCRHYNHGEGILDSPEKTPHDTPPEAGVWHVHELQDAHHLSVVPIWVGSGRQKAFWRDLGQWLRAIDSARVDDVIAAFEA
ncbi:uncharacterized protein BXZ73DRAFT_96757 [Epithele typhae]|uniref:uncharacterized protein n=1 Tax=Epithele typhae TaxID=378194 RepID=UPI002007D0EB|nr:uncharacterized protein BXZ73DRAFT_96757 [Epithele typhae]KAH9944264.1 hypothetical protein BXZ73DRAFT_96757 [Epithele typhae]